jgi:ABC-type uncharacterized transport system auxiliary subunit
MNVAQHNHDTDSAISGRARKLIGGSILALSLTGCAPTPRDIQLFAPLPVTPVQPLATHVLLAPIDAAPAYLGKDITYRLRYDAAHLRFYSDSRWTEPPIEQLAHSLHAAANGYLLILNEQRQTAHCALNIELLSYDHVFSTTGQSQGEVHLRYALTHLRSHRKLKQGELRIEIPATTADARGGATALQHANQNAATQLLDWLRTSINEPNPRVLCAR